MGKSVMVMDVQGEDKGRKTEAEVDGQHQTLLDREGITGFAKLKKFQRFKKNWIELTPPTHPHPNFFWKPITDTQTLITNNF